MSEPKLKRIPKNAKSFEANGHKYFIQSELSLARYTEYIKIQNEIAFGVDLNGMYSTLKRIFDTVTTGNDVLKALASIREISYNQINAVVDFVQRDQPTILRFCALFCNREDEDIRVWDERMVAQKIEDWTEEGLEIDDFFYLAGSYNPTFKQMLIDTSGAKLSGGGKTPPRKSTPGGSTSRTPAPK